MNRIILWLGLYILLGCSAGKEPPSKENTWLKVNLIDKDVESVELSDAYDFLVSTSHKEEDGLFHLSLNTSSGAYYQLKYEGVKFPIYLSPNYRLEVTFDTTEQKAIKFLGRGKESNDYLLAFAAFELANKPAYDQLLAKSEGDFLVEARRYRSKSEAFLQNYQEHNFNLDPNFISKERARILYAWANRLINYPEAHIYYTGEDEFVLSDTYHDYKKTVNLDAPDLISLPEYQTFVRAYIDSEAEILQKKGDKRNGNLIRFDLASQLITEPIVQDYVLYTIISDALQFGIDEINAKLSETFLTKCQNANMRAEIINRNDRWQALSSGHEAPDLSAVKIDGKIYHNSQHKGKFLYLRFWTSWCQPCISDYLNLIEIQDSVKHDNFIIVSVNLDPEKNIWKDIIRDQGYSGILEVQVPTNEVEKVKRDFQINSFPRYILIDPEGRLVEGTAPPPSDPALMNLLTNYAIASNY